MLEHIFRNMDDIRIFDIMTDFVSSDCTLDRDEIMDILEYPEYKRIQVEDSLDYLVRQHILSIVQKKEDVKTGCNICKHLDKLNIPRMGGHKTHIPEQTNIGFINEYYMENNAITQSLINAIHAHVLISEGLEEYVKDSIVTKTTKKAISQMKNKIRNFFIRFCTAICCLVVYGHVS